MSLRPYKFQVVAVVQRIDADGVVVAEQAVAVDGKPAEVFGVSGLLEYAEGFEATLAGLESAAS